MYIPPSNMSAQSLSTLADQTVEKSTADDTKTNRARRNAALSSNEKAAKEQIKLNQGAANERLESAKKKTNGGLFGAIIGAILCAIAIVAACTGVGAPLAVALLGLGVACLTAGSSIGGLVGAKAAEGNDKKAETLKTQADRTGVDEKESEKIQEDLKDQIKATQDARNQLFQDARKRNEEANRTAQQQMAG